MGLFKKKKKKKVYSTDLVATKIFDDDLLEQTKIRLILDKVRNNKSAKDYIMNYGNTGAAQFFQYYLAGKYDFGDGLPDTTIGAVGVPSSVMESIIQSIEGSGVTLIFINFSYAPPEDDIWVKWHLQELIDYDVGNDFVEYNGNYYSLKDYDYDEVTDTFDIVISTQHNITITTKEVVKRVCTDLNLLFDTQTTTVTHTTTYTDTDDNTVLFTTSEVISVTDTTVIVNTGSNSVTSTTLSTILYTNPDLEETINIPAYIDEMAYYSVEYILALEGTTKLWIYDPTTGTYPQLENATYTTYAYETYPITMFRNNVFSVDEYNINSKVVQSGNVNETIYRPATITETRYKETKKVLNGIGLTLDDLLKEIKENESIDKVQDGFIVVGVSPSNKVPIVSKALYTLFDYIYNKLPPTLLGVDATYYMNIYELPYNAQLSWIPQIPTIANEVIGSLGTYTHDFVNDTITQSSVTIANYVYYPKTNQEHVYLNDGTNNTFRVTTDSNGRKWANIIVQTIVNNDGTFVHVYEQREVVIISSTKAKLIKYTDITVYNMVMKRQITKTQTRTIRLGNLAPKQTGVSTQAGEYLWSNSISRGSFGGTINLSLSDSRLVLPLPVHVVEKLTYMERTDLMAWGVYVIFYAAQYDVIKYYVGTAFGKWLKIVAVVVAIVVTIVSSGAASPIAGGLIGLTAASVGTVLSTIASIFESLLIGLALTVALKLISSSVGNIYIKMILSIAVMAVAAYASGGFNSFNLDLKTAVQLSELATKAIDMYVDNKLTQINKKMNRLESQWSSFTSQYESRSEELEKVFNQITSGIDVDFMVKLTTDVGTSFHANTSYSPSLLRYIMIEGYKNFDVLYENDIETFFKKQLQLGILTGDDN